MATDTLALVRTVVDGLTSGPEGTTVALGVDDAHLLDDLSTFVLHQIVQRRAAKVVLTVRDRDPVPAGTREVWTAGQFERLALQPLSSDDTAELLSAALAGRVDPDTAHRMWALTRGNVLYLRNIVEHEVADGRLAPQGGVWRWSGDPVVPPSLVEMIEARIGTLGGSVCDVMDALAVGEPIDLASLTRIADAAAVEEADTRGLISVESIDGRTQVRAAHPLYAQVRRNRAAPTRLRRIRGLVATELATCAGDDDMRTAVRRAALSLDSDLTPDPDLYLGAAQGAVWLADLPLADRLAAAAIRAGAGAQANVVRAHALSWLGRGAQADAVLADSPTDGLTDADHARLAFLRAGTMLWALGDLSGAKKLVDDASRTTPPVSRGCLDAFLSVYWAAVGNPDTALESAKSLVLERLPGIVGAEAAWAITQAAGDAGRTTQAVAAAQAGYPFLTRSFDAPQMGFVLTDAHVGALLLGGRVQDAWRAAERLREQSADLPGGAQLLSNVVAGRAALGAGRLDTACSLLEPVIQMLSASAEGPDGTVYKCLIPYTIALAVRGLTDEATAALDGLERHRHPSWQCVDHERALAHARVAAARGAVGAAITTVLSAADIARQRGQFAAEVACLQTATQFGDRSGASRLRELEASVEGPRVGVAARFARALDAGDGGELAAVSGEFERIGDVIAAADAAAHAALVYRRQGRRGSASVCAARARLRSVMRSSRCRCRRGSARS